jgi:hypothetical protein
MQIFIKLKTRSDYLFFSEDHLFIHNIVSIYINHMLVSSH